MYRDFGFHKTLPLIAHGSHRSEEKSQDETDSNSAAGLVRRR